LLKGVISVFCCVCLCLLPVSQHALAVVVEVYEGETSVLLPCQDTGVTLKNRTVLWTRNDLDPKSVHLRREETDDVTGQNQRYRERTSMRPDALDTLDFSLTLKNPQPTDSGIYTCSILNEREELKLTDIHSVDTKENKILLVQFLLFLLNLDDLIQKVLHPVYAGKPAAHRPNRDRCTTCNRGCHFKKDKLDL
uniref:Ig-like domain-containing protein n=1 Tax=Oreochromis aureus TaxID=47969 RepID=A0AAZ1WV62_OREAU